MNTVKPFPLKGVIGLVANSFEELKLATANGLSCVEVRADLLLSSGLTLVDVMAVVQQASARNLASLFTLRHPTHGGTFHGTESERARISREALQHGADMIDLEWNTDAANELLADQAPMILSYHDFKAMPSAEELQTLTRNMERAGSSAIKVVPTAATLADSARMLSWVKESAKSDIKRIGFAMGDVGRCSRILTTAYGAPITYATFGDAVAPGQIAIDKLIHSYRVASLNEQTKVIAVINQDDATENETEQRLNKQYAANNSNRVAISFGAQWQEELRSQQNALRIHEIV